MYIGDVDRAGEAIGVAPSRNTKAKPKVPPKHKRRAKQS